MILKIDSLNDINLAVYALLREAKYMITPVPNRGNQSFMNEPINRQLYEMMGENQNILRYGTISNEMRSRGTKIDEYPTTLDFKKK